mgnify:CR=1 FL=1
MTRFSFIVATAFCAFALASCSSKEDVPTKPVTPPEEEETPPEDLPDSGPSILNISVGALVPSFDGNTKVAFNDLMQTAWTGNEIMDVVSGQIDDDDTGNGNSVACQIVTKDKGIFGGLIDLGTLPLSRIRAVVVPGKKGSWVRKSVTYRLRVPFPAEQKQEKEGVFSGENIILYAPVKATDLTDASGGAESSDPELYTIDNLQLRWGCAMARFNIFGKHPDMGDDETVSCVKVTMKTPFPSDLEVRLDNDAQVFNSMSNKLSVTLTRPFSVAGRTRDNGAKVFMSLFPKKNTISSISVFTDKATYTKTLSAELLPADASKGDDLRGEAYSFDLDLSSFNSREDGLAFAGDDGIWDSSIPKAFTKLRVRGAITGSVLSDIRNSAASQSAPIDLDLSESTYESNVFPVTFAESSTSSSGDGVKIKSIIFPSNVDEIAPAAFQYCASLQQVNLDGVKVLGVEAFNYSGLKSVEIPNTVESIGGFAFGRCFNLENVYYNSPSGQDGSSIGLNRQTFSNRGNSDGAVANNKNTQARPLRFVFGPDVKVVPECFFDSNPKLSEVVFECAPKFYSSWAVRCPNLRRIVIRSTQLPDNSSSPNVDSGSASPGSIYYTYNAGGDIPSGARTIIIPEGRQEADYASANPWKKLLDERGFNFEGNIVYPSASGWEVADPSEFGYDSSILEEIKGMMGSNNSAGPTDLFVSVGGKQIFANGNISHNSYYIASCRKSILSMAYGKYVENGTIDLDETLGELGISDRSYVYGGQQYPGELTDLEKTATVFNVITARSGIYHVAGYSGGEEEDHISEWNTVVPGTQYVYNNWDFDMACHIFNLKVGKDFYDVLYDDFVVPMELQDYNRAIQNYSLTRPEYSIYPAFPIKLSARDFARFGYLMLRGGKWKGKELVPASWVQKSTSCITDSAGMGGNTRYEWGIMWWRYSPSWTNSHPQYKGAIAAKGSGGQYLFVLPALDMVVAAKNRTHTGNITQMRLIMEKILSAKTD